MWKMCFHRMGHSCTTTKTNYGAGGEEQLEGIQMAPFFFFSPNEIFWVIWTSSFCWSITHTRQYCGLFGNKSTCRHRFIAFCLWSSCECELRRLAASQSPLLPIRTRKLSTNTVCIPDNGLIAQQPPVSAGITVTSCRNNEVVGEERGGERWKGV